MSRSRASLVRGPDKGPGLERAPLEGGNMRKPPRSSHERELFMKDILLTVADIAADGRALLEKGYIESLVDTAEQIRDELDMLEKEIKEWRHEVG
jgi:hypothetical protein